MDKISEEITYLYKPQKMSKKIIIKWLSSINVKANILIEKLIVITKN